MKKYTTSTGKKVSAFTCLMCLTGAMLTCGLLGSCAYTETMNDRNAEGVRLQKELGTEVERGNRLSRQTPQ